MYEMYYKKFYENFDYLSRIYGEFNVFNDLLKMGAISIYNAFAKNQEMEQEYLKTINRYEKEEQLLFPKMFGDLIMMYEKSNDIVDILGPLYEKEHLGNSHLGQFFTPSHISHCMAEIVFSEKDFKKILEEKQYITMNEPTCGAGRYDTFFCKSLTRT